MDFNIEVIALKKKQVFGFRQIGAIKKNGLMCTVSDFAILLGARVFGVSRKNEESSRSRTCSWHLSSIDYLEGKHYYINEVGKLDFNLTSTNVRYIGIRPVISFKRLKDLFPNCQKIADLSEVIYGEYPQYVVDNNLTLVLENLFQNNRLRKTGKTYTTDSRKCSDFFYKFTPIEHEEFEYNGKKYVRVKENIYDFPEASLENFKLSNDMIVKRGTYVWLEVTPIKWTVDKKAKLLVCKTVLASGIKADLYKGSFEETEIYNWLNTFFIKDIIPSWIKKTSNEEELEVEYTIEDLEDTKENNVKSNDESQEEILANEIQEEIELTEDKYDIEKQGEEDCFNNQEEQKGESSMSSSLEKKAAELLEQLNDFCNNLDSQNSAPSSKIKEMKDKIQTLLQKKEESSSREKEDLQDESASKTNDKKSSSSVINLNDVEHLKKRGEVYHKSFNDVLEILSLGLHPLLVGPAGSGKNVILEQAAKALDLKFHYVNDVTEEHKVMGFVDANGNFQKTQFFEAFTNGGLIMIDEMDNSSPSALLAINAALGTGYHQYLTFPDGKLYEINPNFYLAAAANTYGTGSDAIYCGRSALDGASLNRFVPVFIDYDKNLEKKIIKHTEILNLYWKVRESIYKNRIRHVISTRNIVNADKLIESRMFDYGKIFDFTIIQSMTEDDLRMILMDLASENDNLIKKFIKHLESKGIVLNEYDLNGGRQYVSRR